MSQLFAPMQCLQGKSSHHDTPPTYHLNIYAPILTCTIEAQSRMVKASIMVDPDVKVSHVKYDIVEHLNYATTNKQGIPYSKFTIKLPNRKWNHFMTIVEKMCVPSPAPHQRILGEVPTKAYYGVPPKPLLLSAIHGIFGADLTRAKPATSL